MGEGANVRHCHGEGLNPWGVEETWRGPSLL